MKKMPRCFALLLILLCILFALCACSDSEPDAPSPEDTPVQDEELFIPPSADIKDGTAFSDIIYTHPETDALIESIESLTVAIKAGYSLPTILPEAIRINKSYNDFLSMQAYASIMYSINTEDAFYASEYNHFKSVFPELEEKFAYLISAASKSADASHFSECFGADTMIKYASTESPTTEAAQLRAAEADLIEEYGELVKNSSLTDEQKKERTLEIFIRLLEIRSNIATEYGYANYTEYIYATTLSEYSPDEFGRLYEHIASYIVPVYNKLASRVLNSNSRHPIDPHAKNKILNHLGQVLEQMDGDVGNAYSYMIYYGLFNVEPDKSARIKASATSFLPSYNSPFLYATLENSLTDYMSICREFGRFYDLLSSNSERGSSELAEVSSQAMALLALNELQGSLTSKEYKYLSCMEYERIILAIINNSLYSCFEHTLYNLPYHEINEVTVSAAAESALATMGINSSSYQGPEDLISPLLITNPFEVQTYVSSSIVSLEIFFEEKAVADAGLAIYKLLIHHSDNISLSAYLDRVGLSSPLDEETVKHIANSLHYFVLGSHYFEDGTGGDTAYLHEPGIYS